MSATENPVAAQAQSPAPGMLNIDHVAHFVPDMEATTAALQKLGFTLTPLSNQSHRLTPDGPLVPAGTANRCVMLERGYLEFLTPTLDTPVADQLRTAISRYVGVHLVAFGTASPDADHARLAAAGFNPLAPVALQRPIPTLLGEDTARFTVVRVPPGTMAEGRIQYCRHHTPELLWQERWLAHENGALGLSSVIVCVADADEAAQRYARFTAIAPKRLDTCWVLESGRGNLVLASAEAVQRSLGLTAPALPWIAGYALEVRDLGATRERLAAAGAQLRELSPQHVVAELSNVLGGAIVFSAAGAPLPL